MGDFMKLNQKDLNELRNEIEKQLEQIPEGSKIKIEKQLLEQLIFNTGKSEEGTPYKAIVWSGPFLRKIDLSKLSFDNVTWDRDDVAYSKVRLATHFKYIIDLSNTNAKIDFSKSFKVKETIKNNKDISSPEQAKGSVILKVLIFLIQIYQIQI